MAKWWERRQKHPFPCTVDRCKECESIADEIFKKLVAKELEQKRKARDEALLAVQVEYSEEALSVLVDTQLKINDTRSKKEN